MTMNDLDFASSLTLAEKWHSETLEEFEGFFSHAPAGCLIAEQGGRRVGIGVATPYQDAGFLGQIVVIPELRGQGIGSLIVGALLSYLRSIGVRSVYLDATKAGAPLYERHGFRKVQPSLRYSGKVCGAYHAHVRSMRAEDLDAVYSLDRRWWGTDRTFFLKPCWLAAAPINFGSDHGVLPRTSNNRKCCLKRWRNPAFRSRFMLVSSLRISAGFAPSINWDSK
jgi:ribosomal protein S18 acetylase RimI-like enzyme